LRDGRGGTVSLSTPSHKYGVVPRASMRRSCKARDRGVLVEYCEEAERGRSGCSGDRMQAYLWDGVLSDAQEVVRLDDAEGKDRESRLQEALKELLEKSPDIDAAAVVSMDGYVLASILPADYGEDRLGAMSAALLSLGERTADELGRGELAQVFIEGTHGYVFLLAAGHEGVLTTIVRRGSKLGLVLYDIRNAAKNIAAIFESDLQIEYE